MKAAILSLAAIVVTVAAAPIGPYTARSSPVSSYTSGYDESLFSHLQAASREAGIIELGGSHAEKSVLPSNVRVPAIRGRVPIKLEVMVDISPDFS